MRLQFSYGYGHKSRKYHFLAAIFLRSCGRMAARVTCGRNSLAVTVTVLAVTVLADWPQCGYGRMVKKALRSYTNVRQSSVKNEQNKLNWRFEKSEIILA